MPKRKSRNESELEEGGPSSSTSSSTVLWLKSLVILLVLIVYLFAGALVFRTIEQPPSHRAAERFNDVLLKLAEENDCMDDVAVKDLMDIVTRAIGEGAYGGNNVYEAMLDFQNESHVEGTWSFEHSFMFSFTVVTTIGYGNLAPRTKLGEFFCVIYAVFGISVVAALLYTIGEILQYLFFCNFQATEKLCSCLIVSHPRVKKLLCIIYGFVIAYFMLTLLPSVIFELTQEWTFIESYYFSVIALSTIGLGDMVPEYEDLMIQLTVVIHCLLYMYFFICLGMISMILNIVSKKQAQVGMNMARTVEHSAFWIRLQHQFQQKGPPDDDEVPEHGIPMSPPQPGDRTRRLSSAEMWTKIRLSVDYNNSTHEALLRIRRRSEGIVQPSLKEEEENETEIEV